MRFITARGAVMLMLALGATPAVGTSAPATMATAVEGAYEAELAQASELIDAWSGRPEPLEQAKARLDAVLALDPNVPEAHRLYARLHIVASYLHGDEHEPEGLKRAEASLDRAIGLAPTFAEAFVLRGHLYRLQERPDEAEAALAQAEALGSDSPWLALNRADLELDAGEYEAALALCRPVARTHADNAHVLDGAEDCLMEAYRGLGRVDDLDAAYRRAIDRDPEAAWPRGNYAGFLLCTRQNAKAAIEHASAALQRMDYGVGRRTLAAALYRDWADRVHAGQAAEAERAWATASAFAPDDPAQLVAATCSQKAAEPVLYALRDTYRATLIPPMVAVLAAAESGRKGLIGVFGVEVVATGASRGEVYLNSEADYRDQRNLTVRFTPDAAAAYRAKHGQDPDAALKGKRVMVVGTARRQRIDFMSFGAPTGKYYYQTHVVVTDPAQVAVYDPDARPAPSDVPLPPAIEA